MDYRVNGAKRDNGQPTTVIIEASSQADAEAKANKRGILVESCTPAKSPVEAVPQTATNTGGFWNGPIPKVVLLVWLLGTTGISIMSFVQAKEAKAELADVRGKSELFQQQLPTFVGKAMASFQEGAQRTLNRVSAESSAPSRAAVLTKEEAIANDPMISRLAQRYPEFKSAMKHSPSTLSSMVSMWVATGDLTASDAEYVRNFAKGIESLPY